MACEMCASNGKVTAEVRDDSFAQRLLGSGAAEVDAECNVWIKTNVTNEHGLRLNVILPVLYCPWCGEKLEDQTEWCN